MNERDPRRKDEFIMTDFLIILWSLAVACLSTSIDSISDLKACHEIHLYIKTWYTHWQSYTIWIMGKMVAVEISAIELRAPRCMVGSDFSSGFFLFHVDILSRSQRGLVYWSSIKYICFLDFSFWSGILLKLFATKPGLENEWYAHFYIELSLLLRFFSLFSSRCPFDQVSSMIIWRLDKWMGYMQLVVVSGCL